MPSFFSTLCVAIVSACATLGQASVIPEKRAPSGIVYWSGALANGTVIQINGTFPSILAQINTIEPGYKAAPTTIKTLDTIGAATCNPKGVKQTNSTFLQGLANDIVEVGGNCNLQIGGGGPSEWENGDESACITWINDTPPSAHTLFEAPCAFLADLILNGITQCVGGVGEEIAVSNHDMTSWTITGGAC